MKRGDVYRVELDPTVGSEQRKTRPCVIVRRTVDERDESKSPMTVVVPLADARGRAGNVLHVRVTAGLGGMSKDSRAICNQIRAVDKSRFRGDALGQLPAEIMTKIDAGLRVLLDL